MMKLLVHEKIYKLFLFDDFIYEDAVYSNTYSLGNEEEVGKEQKKHFIARIEKLMNVIMI